MQQKLEKFQKDVKKADSALQKIGNLTPKQKQIINYMRYLLQEMTTFQQDNDAYQIAAISTGSTPQKVKQVYTKWKNQPKKRQQSYSSHAAAE